MSNVQLHHVGLLMPTEEAAQQFMKLIGLEEERRGYVPEYQALCIFAKGNGASPVELVIPGKNSTTRFRAYGSGISISIMAEARHLPWISSASVRVTPPPKAFRITKFRAPIFGIS